MDLRAEPIVLSMPAVEEGRYYSVMLADINTYNYGYIGTRTTGNEAADLMVAGPGWKGETPAGIKKTRRVLGLYQMGNFSMLSDLQKDAVGVKFRHRD